MTAAENLDIMSVILRASNQPPRLDARTMQRLARCAVAYDEYKRERRELEHPEDDEGPSNDDAWLYEDLHVYRRLVTKARDKEQLIELIFEVSKFIDTFSPNGEDEERADFRFSSIRLVCVCVFRVVLQSC